MSFDSPKNPEPNPYQSPNFSDLPQCNFGSANPELSSSILTQQRVVAILMMIQGTLSVLMGLVFIGAAIMLPQLITADMQRQARPPGGPNTDQMMWILLGTYSVMGACGIIPGLLLIYAGFQNLWLRGYTLGIVALSSGAISLGTCYCLPTALALLIYGLIIYLNVTTKKAFALAKEGETYDSIMQRAIGQRYGGA
jgi:hypothetical protein